MTFIFFSFFSEAHKIQLQKDTKKKSHSQKMTNVYVILYVILLGQHVLGTHSHSCSLVPTFIGLVTSTQTTWHYPSFFMFISRVSRFLSGWRVWPNCLGYMAFQTEAWRHTPILQDLLSREIFQNAFVVFSKIASQEKNMQNVFLGI